MPSLKVAITGSRGLVGTALVARLADAGHQENSDKPRRFHIRRTDAEIQQSVQKRGFNLNF